MTLKVIAQPVSLTSVRRAASAFRILIESNRGRSLLGTTGSRDDDLAQTEKPRIHRIRTWAE